MIEDDGRLHSGDRADDRDRPVAPLDTAELEGVLAQRRADSHQRDLRRDQGGGIGPGRGQVLTPVPIPTSQAQARVAVAAPERSTFRRVAVFVPLRSSRGSPARPARPEQPASGVTP